MTSNKQNYLDIQEVSWLKSWEEEGKERKRKKGREGERKEEKYRFSNFPTSMTSKLYLFDDSINKHFKYQPEKK